MTRSVWSTIVDVALVLVAGCFLLAWYVTVWDATTNGSSDPAPVAAGVMAGIAGLGILCIVALGRARSRPRRSPQRLTGIVGALLGITLGPILAFNAAYFGASAWAVLWLGTAAVLTVIGALLLHRY